MQGNVFTPLYRALSRNGLFPSYFLCVPCVFVVLSRRLKVRRARSGNSGESNPHLPIRTL